VSEARYVDVGPIGAFSPGVPTPVRIGDFRAVILREDSTDDEIDRGGARRSTPTPTPRICAFAEACPHAGDSLTTGFRDGAAFVKLAVRPARSRDGRVEVSA
jgi:hypothetical protein